MSGHTCHAKGCDTPCKRQYLMCWYHWRMVPPDMQQAVYAHYRPGQTKTKRVSREWLKAARSAINRVAAEEATKK